MFPKLNMFIQNKKIENRISNKKFYFLFYALGWAFLYIFFNPSSWNCIYTCVEDISECPSIVWIAFKSAPFCKRCVANECLKTCGVISFVIWACSL